ncbi:MAG: Fe(2+) transporter permease subunit FeoB, partial [Deltaproteobacteria bacterium]|nr:Fe(2+) transporter permease subunit FeoB [Deltaproteobacteria bacterium]
LIISIVDASNLERNLYLTVQLLEMKVPVVVALNMMDVARNNGIDIDISSLSKRLDCPVVPIVATKKEGLKDLKNTINNAAAQGAVSRFQIEYPAEIQHAIDALMPELAKVLKGIRLDQRWVAVKLLEDDPWAVTLVSDSVKTKAIGLRQNIENQLDEEIDILIADSRYSFINKLTKDTLKKKRQISATLSDKIDRIVLNRAAGIPVFLAAMYLTFMITINLGGAFIDFFDIFAGTIFVDGFGHLLTAAGLPEWVIAILAGGIGGGIQTIATFIPPIGFMFLCLSFLEDSGYMARAAFVMDRFMRFIGLPGKSFVPMLVGFGCNVPAVMATRTLENQRDRTLTIMMNPFMSCGARLPVYALFAAAFFPVGGQNLVFGLYLIGIGFAVITGLILKSTLLKGEITPFVMELPPYHLPTLRGVVFHAWDRLKAFMLRASRVLIPVIIVLSFLNSMGTDGSFGNEDTDKSVLSYIGRSITPIFKPMGLTEENWPATVGIFTGIFAKEAVVGTLNAMYSRLGAEAGAEEGEEAFAFWDGIKESFVTIPQNLADVVDTMTDPLGISIGDVSDAETAAEELEVGVGVFGAMTRLFDGRVGAFAYLLFILMYFPCVAAIAAVYRETTLGWTLFAGTWTTGMAYTAATLFYQAATIGRNPVFSILWIAVVIGAFVAVVLFLRYLGNRKETGVSPLMKEQHASVRY